MRIKEGSVLTIYNLPVEYDNFSWPERREIREQYIEEQNNLCWYCGEDLFSDPPEQITEKSINLELFPIGFLNAPIHLQHDHGTGLTEGAVHGYCNAVLWQYYGKWNCKAFGYKLVMENIVNKDNDEKKEEFPDEWTEHIENIIEELFKRNPDKRKH